MFQAKIDAEHKYPSLEKKQANEKLFRVQEYKVRTRGLLLKNDHLCCVTRTNLQKNLNCDTSISSEELKECVERGM